MALVRRERPEWPEVFRRLFETDWDTGYLRVEEFQDGDDLVVRAEMPGIDPDKDVEVSVSDGALHISAHREEKSETKSKDGYRSEFRYGSFARTLQLPAGMDEDTVKATYTDGVLEIRVPVGPPPKPSITRVPIVKT